MGGDGGATGRSDVERSAGIAQTRATARRAAPLSLSFEGEGLGVRLLSHDLAFARVFGSGLRPVATGNCSIAISHPCSSVFICGSKAVLGGMFSHGCCGSR